MYLLAVDSPFSLIINTIIYFYIQKEIAIFNSPITIMSQVNQRTHKLLILAGDEGANLEARDFKKIRQVIVNNYIASGKPSYFQFFSKLFPAVIQRVPLKQHIYAGLTKQICSINQSYAIELFRSVVSNLQKDLNQLRIHQSINGIIYLSELMNLQKLNSQCFFDLIDDIVSYLENCKNSNHRAFFIQVFSKTLHNFCFSLNKKVYFEFKKLLQRAKKFCNKNTQFTVLFQAHQKGTVNDGSIAYRIYQQSNISNQDQIQENIKLKIALSQSQKYVPIEYHFSNIDQSDKLYQQFHKNEGPYHTTNLQQIIQTMKQNGQFMFPKLKTYVDSWNEGNSFMHRFIVDFLLAKGLKSRCSAVQSSILIKLIKSNKIYAQIIQSAFYYGIHNQSQNYDLGSLMKFAQLLTYIVNNWPNGGNQMTDISPWDWEKFLTAPQNNSQQDANGVKNSAKKNVLFGIISLKLMLLGDSFKVPNQLKKFAPPDEFINPTKYKAIQKMQLQQKFIQLLKKKSQYEQFLQSIKEQGDYQVFLQTLFQRTSQSHKHLEVLLDRYQKIFLKFKQDYDWNFINTIRSYWSKSLFHRLLYLETVIERGYVDFASYVKYIGKVETNNQEEACWVKLQLNQLHNIFAERLEKKD